MQRKQKIFLSAAVLPLALAVSQVNAQSIDDKVNDLEQELKALKASLAKPGVEIKKGTTFNYGGYIKADFMFTEYDAGNVTGISDNLYVPSTVPVGNGDGDVRFHSDVKKSRLWFKTATQTDAGVIRSHIEMDFLSGGGDERISNSTNSRVRHAYFAWDYNKDSSLLVGQTWSTFFNVGALPESVEFIGTTAGTVFVRQNQIRLTKKSGSNSWMFALENPSTSLNDGGGGIDNNNYDDNVVPDLIARYNGKSGDLSYSAAAMVREIAYRDGANDDSAYAGALSLSGKWMLGKDDIKFMLSYGTLGRYLALNAYRDGAIEADGDIDLNNQLGGFVAYRHWWSDKLRSTVAYAMSSTDNSDSVAGTTTESTDNQLVNLMYSPTKKLTLGAELLFANRETEAGDDGKLTRLMFSSKYVF